MAIVGPILFYRVLAVSLLFISVNGNRPRLNSYSCASEACTKDGRELIQSVDATVRPCDDFFHHACGSWIKNIAKKTSIRDSEDLRLRISIKNHQYNGLATGNSPLLAVKKAMALYRLCLKNDEDNPNNVKLENVFQTLQTSFPVLHCNQNPWNPRKYNFHNEMLVYMIYGLNPFVKINVLQDHLNPGRNILKVKVSPLLITSVVNYRRFGQKVENFYTMLLKSFRAPTLKYISDVQAIMVFDRRAIQIKNMYPSGERRYTLTSLEQEIMQKKIARKPFIDLVRLIRNVADYIKRHTPDFDMSTINEVVVVNPQRLPHYENLINEFLRMNPRVLANKAAINTMIQLKKLLPRHLRDPIYAFLNVEHENIDRIEQCMGLLSHAESRFYIDSTRFQKSFFVDHMFKEIKGQLLKTLQRNRFMDTGTKGEAITKVQNILGVQGYEAWIKDDNALNSYYHKVQLYQRNGLRSYLTVTANSFEHLFKSLDRKYIYRGDEDIWEDNAHAYQERLKFVVFAGLLHPPYYRVGSSSARNFGSIGSVIGHELGHFIDNIGKDYDSKGVIRNWWSPVSAAEYGKRVMCVNRQYRQYSLATDRGFFSVDGEYTVNENIADILGLRVAYWAFKEYERRNTKEVFTIRGLHYTPDQLFFLSFAHMYCEKIDPAFIRDAYQDSAHSPNSIRVRGSLTGFKPFIDAFQCGPNSNYAGPSCNIWE